MIGDPRDWRAAAARAEDPDSFGPARNPSAAVRLGLAPRPRCEERNEAGRRCGRIAHDDELHLYEGDPELSDYRFDTLQHAVRLFLDSKVDRDFLARALATTAREE